MKKLRIAFISSSNPTSAGGVQEHILYLSTLLRKRGHTVHIYGPDGKDNRLKNYTAISNLIDIPTPGGNYTSINILHPSFKFNSVFTRSAYDIVHVHEPYMPIAAWTMLEKISVPTVATFHTAWDDSSPINLINNIIPLFKEQFSSSVQSAIFVSQVTKRRWESMCDQTVNRIVIRNGVDIDLFKPKLFINSIPLILFAARLVNRKGALHLVNAVKILKDRKRKFKVIIIGDGKEKNEVKAAIQNNKVSKYISFLGEIKGRARAKYFYEADIFCAPYVNEAAPLTILEAISSGLPIVGFMNESFKENLAHYPGRELLVKRQNAALADALESCLIDKNKIQVIKNWCLTHRESLSWDAVITQTESVYFQTIQTYEKKNI